MHRIKNFEEIHPNHKWAFIDGLLTGAVLLYLTEAFRKNIKETYDV